MPFTSHATRLTALARTAVKGMGIDRDSVTTSITCKGATITFASSGDAGVDRRAIKRIYVKLRLSEAMHEFDWLPLPLTVRPAADDAMLMAAADSLRYMATRLEQAASGAADEMPTELARKTALVVAENVLSGS